MIIVRLMVDKEESCLRKKYVLLIMIIYGYDFSAASRLTFLENGGLYVHRHLIYFWSDGCAIASVSNMASTIDNKLLSFQ